MHVQRFCKREKKYSSQVTHHLIFFINNLQQKKRSTRMGPNKIGQTG
jgi:hypothetical protein